jgi:hypothetical protein
VRAISLRSYRRASSPRKSGTPARGVVVERAPTITADNQMGAQTAAALAWCRSACLRDAAQAGPNRGGSRPTNPLRFF